MFYYGQRSKCADLLNSYNITNIKESPASYTGNITVYEAGIFYETIFYAPVRDGHDPLCDDSRVDRQDPDGCGGEHSDRGVSRGDGGGGDPGGIWDRDNEGAGRARKDVCVPDRGSRDRWGKHGRSGKCGSGNRQRRRSCGMGKTEQDSGPGPYGGRAGYRLPECTGDGEKVGKRTF